jgi:hypothetical protein
VIIIYLYSAGWAGGVLEGGWDSVGIGIGTLGLWLFGETGFLNFAFYRCLHDTSTAGLGIGRRLELGLGLGFWGLGLESVCVVDVM